MKFLRLNGATIHYEYWPLIGRPTIVFVNSLGTDLRIWNEVRQRLADAYGLVAFDKRGHGLSELGAGVQSIETYATDLASLLDRLGVKNCVICGLSIGGIIAQSIYASRPEMIDGLILCDTAAKIGTPAMWNERIDATLSQGIASFADGVMEKWFTPRFHREHAEELAGYRTMLTRQEPAGYAAACAAIRDADFIEAAAAIKVPTLCIVGDQDGSTPPDLVETFARSVPGGRFEVMASAGHIPCVEQPERLSSLIRAFMENDLRTAGS